VGVSGVGVEAVVMSNALGLLTVRVKPTPAKAVRPEPKKRRA
jgi:hypothetical protein